MWEIGMGAWVVFLCTTNKLIRLREKKTRQAKICLFSDSVKISGMKSQRINSKNGVSGRKNLSFNTKQKINND